MAGTKYLIDPSPIKDPNIMMLILKENAGSMKNIESSIKMMVDIAAKINVLEVL
ncbi:MAG: hypothetical protein MASP_01719 [Candidatus Methanolliviera sp. GoM_asphalt]|nr:MAG: hypothetical protein MASP_01719 [Candidatus Methanolliviera sp. GoM_asphalt]